MKSKFSEMGHCGKLASILLKIHNSVPNTVSKQAICNQLTFKSLIYIGVCVARSVGSFHMEIKLGGFFNLLLFGNSVHKTAFYHAPFLPAPWSSQPGDISRGKYTTAKLGIPETSGLVGPGSAGPI